MSQETKMVQSEQEDIILNINLSYPVPKTDGVFASGGFKFSGLLFSSKFFVQSSSIN